MIDNSLNKKINFAEPRFIGSVIYWSVYSLGNRQRRGTPVQLIGMLDSPYVRRVAISLQLLRLRFEHRSLSVFRTFTEFQQINPVVKAPTFVCGDGEVLMDSTLILEYAEAVARPRSLMQKIQPSR